MDVLRLLITTADLLYASKRSGTCLILEKREAGLGREFGKVGREVQAAVVQIPMRMCFALACACKPSKKTEDTKMKHDVPQGKGRKSASSEGNIDSSRSNSHRSKFGNLSRESRANKYERGTLRLHELALDQKRKRAPPGLVR